MTRHSVRTAAAFPGSAKFKPRRSLAALALLSGLLGGCTIAETSTPTQQAGAEKAFPIFDAADALERDWRKLSIWSKSEWKLTVLDGELAIAPQVDKSSSALTRFVEFDATLCPIAEWTWRVDALPPGAELSSREAEDVAASLIFAFGDPGSFSNPDPVPTLRYVWSTATNPVDVVIDSPYFPGTLRSIPVRSGPQAAEWVTERRDLLADYRLAFGGEPTEKVQVFALFTDNDHLGEPVTAYYRSARMLCSELPETDSILGQTAPARGPLSAG